MIFSRTYRFQTSMRVDDIKSRLLGQHVKIHNLDFEVLERDKVIKVIPHDEQDGHVRTLPITNVEFSGKGDKTQLVISSDMRKIDSGGPMLVVVFSFFLIVAALMFMFTGKSEYQMYTYILGGGGLFIQALFWLRMQRGYFDYVRKVRDHIKKQSTA